MKYGSRFSRAPAMVLSFLVVVTSCATYDYGIIAKGISASNTIANPEPQTVLYETVLSWFAPENRNAKMLFVVLDGVRTDAAVSAGLKRLISAIGNSSSFRHMYTGGIMGTESEQVTMSGAGWTTILTGVWANEHHFRSNWIDHKNPDIDSFLEKVAVVQGKNVATYVSWVRVNRNILMDEKESDRYRKFSSPVDCDDKAVIEAVLSDMETRDCDLWFVGFNDPDHAGETSGFSPIVKNYTDEISSSFDDVIALMKKIKSRVSYPFESWKVIVTTDHGGYGLLHGFQSPAERNVWYIEGTLGLE